MTGTLLALLVAAAPLAQDGGEAARRVSFHADVRPILQARCHGCHQPAKAQGDLVLTSYADLLAGGEHGAAVAPGKPDASLLVEEISPLDDLPPAMPEEGAPLSPAQVELIRRWIAEGAEDDTPPSQESRITAENPPVYARPPVLTSLDFSPGGELLAVPGFHEVLLHAADGSGIVARLVGLSERIESVAFSPDGTRLAVAGGSPARMGELQVWNVAEAALLLSVPVTFDTIYGASWSHDGTRIAFGCSDRTTRVVDAQTGEQVLYQGAHDDWVLDTAFSTDASHLVTVSRDRSMKLIKVATQQFIDNITSITPGALKGGLQAVDRHPQRDELLVGGADGVPKVFRMYREKKRVIGDDYNLIREHEPAPGRIFSVEWSPDGSRLVVGSSFRGKGVARAYAEGGEMLWTFVAQTPVYAVTFDPGGTRVAVGGFDGVVRLVDAASGELVREFVAVPLEGAAKGKPATAAGEGS